MNVRWGLRAQPVRLSERKRTGLAGSSTDPSVFNYAPFVLPKNCNVEILEKRPSKLLIE